MRIHLSLIGLVASLLSLPACAGSDGDDASSDTSTGGSAAGTGGGDDDNDEVCDAPSDTLEVDDFSAGKASVICYYAPSEGYCRELSSAASVGYAEAGDKAAMGCADAVVVTGGTCPLDTAVGRCVNWGTDESRVYYECNKFDAIYPDGLEKGCTDIGGTWEAF